MIDALSAIAAAGGSAVVQAAGTEAWTGLRSALARWFGRGNAQRERVTLERLDHSAIQLASAGTNAVSDQVLAVWRTRFEGLLETLDGEAQEQAAAELSAILSAHSPTPGVSADHGGVAVSGNLDIKASHGSAAAVVMRDVTLGNPPVPGAE
ncbi:hypothetical protein AB0D71_34030 [Streptomyces avermitilis]|uniref:hypothetical protein n=1 Tax=Streptomyces avermitilis TaxID=33903 RepID=UPI00340B9195